MLTISLLERIRYDYTINIPIKIDILSIVITNLLNKYQLIIITNILNDFNEIFDEKWKKLKLINYIQKHIKKHNGSNRLIAQIKQQIDQFGTNE